MATEKTSRLLTNLNIWTGDEPGHSTQYDAIRMLADGTLLTRLTMCMRRMRSDQGLVAMPVDRCLFI